MVHYSHWGSGEHIIIALHGFGESGESFSTIAEKMPAQFQLLAPDLPFHGATSWKDNGDFTPEMLAVIVQKTIQHAGISSSQISLLGYSMGGRIALGLFEFAPAVFNSLLLVSPDGLHAHFVYRFCTRNNPGRTFFQWIMNKPGTLNNVANGVRKLGWIGERQFKFIKIYLQNGELRNLVVNVWTRFSQFRPDRNKVKACIVKYQTPLTILLGRHDPMVALSKSQPWTSGSESLVEIELLDGGHQLLQDRWSAAIWGALSKGIKSKSIE